MTCKTADPKKSNKTGDYYLRFSRVDSAEAATAKAATESRTILDIF